MARVSLLYSLMVYPESIPPKYSQWFVLATWSYAPDVRLKDCAIVIFCILMMVVLIIFTKINQPTTLKKLICRMCQGFS